MTAAEEVREETVSEGEETDLERRLRDERREQGLPPGVEDPAILAQVAALVRAGGGGRGRAPQRREW